MHSLRSALVLLGSLSAVVYCRADLALSAEAAKPLTVGASVPAGLTVKTPEGNAIDLSSTLANQPTVLIFMRGGRCPYCSRHLGELASIEPELLKLGVQIVAVSTDQTNHLRGVAEANAVRYRILSDRDMVASSAFGVAYRVSDEMQRKYTDRGIDMPSVSNDPSARWLPVPAAFVIGKDRVIKFAYSDPDYKIRISADKLLQAVEATLK